MPTPGQVRHSRVADVLTLHRADVLELAARYGASNVRVFGSVARGDDDAASDIDLLADFAPGTSLLTIIELEQALVDMLGVPVDIGPADALRADLREGVLAEAAAL